LSIIAELQTGPRTFNHCRTANCIAGLQTDPRVFQSLQRCKSIRALFNLEHCAMQRQAGNRKMHWHLSAKAAFKMIEETADGGTEATAIFALQGRVPSSTASCC
jgi:hypothetical protein